uniref:Uncharacterized protein n=1 Tax=Asparagopsis taxiformis TaxID=260499 RepID=A0A1C9CCC5_9FLOR|nr:hypothetical protein Aspa_146 [Asparagopsis taxiformis]AOM66025.1 hypothetical protein Aspa_146 [Asparagopsis taxiformis]
MLIQCIKYYLNWFSYYFSISGKEGFEPPTPWFVAMCSNPLSYKPLTIIIISLLFLKNLDFLFYVLV